MDTKMIRIWQFDDAPERYRNLSGHGGDEDWVIVIHKSLKDDVAVRWLIIDQINDWYGPPQETEVGDEIVVITAHA